MHYHTHPALRGHKRHSLVGGSVFGHILRKIAGSKVIQDAAGDFAGLKGGKAAKELTKQGLQGYADSPEATHSQTQKPAAPSNPYPTPPPPVVPPPTSSGGGGGGGGEDAFGVRRKRAAPKKKAAPKKRRARPF